jgi:hypothetical protein
VSQWFHLFLRNLEGVGSTPTCGWNGTWLTWCWPIRIIQRCSEIVDLQWNISIVVTFELCFIKIFIYIYIYRYMYLHFATCYLKYVNFTYLTYSALFVFAIYVFVIFITTFIVVRRSCSKKLFEDSVGR